MNIWIRFCEKCGKGFDVEIDKKLCKKCRGKKEKNGNERDSK